MPSLAILIYTNIMSDNRSFFNKLLFGGGIFFDLAKWQIFIVIFLIFVNAYWFSIFIVDGVSMEPTILNGQLVLFNKVFYRGDRIPQRGETVVVEYPGDPAHKRYVKRVVGLPDETITVSNGSVYINSKKLAEDYLPFGIETDKDGTWRLNRDQYFLMGDNRPLSNDCRYFGPVEKRFFIGHVDWIIYPGIKRLETPAYKNGFAGELDVGS